MAEAPEAVYQRPTDYELEHVGDTENIAFFCGLAKRLRPKRVLELACGSGRVTLPLADCRLSTLVCRVTVPREKYSNLAASLFVQGLTAGDQEIRKRGKQEKSGRRRT